MGVPVKDVVRWKQKDEIAAAGIGESSSDEALLAAMAKYPVLMNRPIVVTEKGVNRHCSSTLSKLEEIARSLRHPTHCHCRISGTLESQNKGSAVPKSIVFADLNFDEAVGR